MKMKLRWKIFLLNTILISFILSNLCVPGLASDLVNIFAGQWSHVNKSSEDHVSLKPDGSYTARGERTYLQSGIMGGTPI